MNLKTVSAALAAAVLAVGMTACHRDNAGAGSSADQYGKRSGSAASGSSSSSPSSPSSPSSMGSSSSRQAAPGGASGSSK
jgi:hypothetical protein